MSCVLCLGKLVNTSEPIHVTYLGVRLRLLGLERSKCTSCGKGFFNPEQASQYSRAAKRQYKIRTSLTGADVARIRKKLNLSQAELESKLGLGNKVIVRWENGKVRLPGPVNVLFKILDKRPEAIRFV